MTASGTSASDRLAAALDYAGRGWHVFPVPPGAKKSYLSARHANGARWGATAYPELIRNSWSQWPDANVGIACRPSSGLFVVECDTPEGHGVDGIGAMTTLLEQHGPLPATIEALSPSGSWHIFFRWPDKDGVGNSSGRIAPGIDVRGEGGMVVAAPSVKPGCARPYRWKNPPGLFGLADCPEWLLALCTRKAAARPKTSAESSGFRIDPGPGAFGDNKASAAEVAELLSWIDPDAGGYQSWLEGLMALHDHFGGSQTGLALAEDWSWKGPKHKPGEVARKWAGFVAGSGMTMATLANRARQNGADLAEIARRHRRGAARPKPLHQKPNGALVPNAVAATSTGSNLRAELPALRSDDALALALATEMEATFLSVLELGQWRVWSGCYWQKDVTGAAQEGARNLCRRSAAQAEGAEARRVASHKTISAVLRLAATDPRITVAASELDRHDMLLNTPGGVVDLATGEIGPNDPGLLMTRITRVGPGGECPRWLRFLDEVTGDDANLVGYLRRLLGYCLTGLTREQVFAFFVGTGANGKSVLLQTVAHVLGDHAATAAPDTFAEGSGSRHLTELAGLAGARLVLVSETREGQAWDEARIKTVTGGGDLRVNFMRQDHFEFRPTFKLVVAGNHRPRLSGAGEAMQRRLHVVPFDVTIPPDQRDPHLPEVLAAEGPGILSWMIAGCLEWQRIGLEPPQRVLEAAEAYIDEEDVFGEWLTAQCVRGDGNRAPAGMLYQNWKRWAEHEGHPPGSKKAFGDALRNHGFKQGRTGAARYWIGIDLRRGSEPPPGGAP